MTDIAAQPAPILHPLVPLARRLIPFWLVGLGLRLLMARVFFLSGQEKIEGITIRMDLPAYNLDFSVILPQHVKEQTFQLFAAKYAALPIPPYITAYLFAYAEFLLPVCLVIGFATRLSALLLLALTVLTVMYAAPETLWTLRIYWIAVLMVLFSMGPGAISLDALIRRIMTRDDTPAYR
jgi:putative oxidoreductase